MNLQRWLQLQMKVSFLLVSLMYRGCRPWLTSRNSLGSRKGTRLYYSENITTAGSYATASNNPRNQTFLSLDEYAFSEDDNNSPLLFADQSRKKPRRSSTLTTVLGHSTAAPRTDTEERESIQRALEQVHAIVDLYELTPSIMSSDIVTSTLDGLIDKIFQDHKAHSAHVLEELEALVWRCEDLKIPLSTIMSLKILLTMQKQAYEVDKTTEAKSHFVERSARLLLFYSQGVETTFRWPNEDLRSLFRFAQAIHAEMTPILWDLFQHIQQHHPDPATAKEFFNDMLQVLAASGSEGIERQYQILRDQEEQYQATNDTIYKVGDETLLRALEAASQHGDAEQATWLFRRLHRRPPSEGLQQQKRLWYLLLEAYVQSNETGSVPYLERLVETHEETQQTDLYNLVLQARARQRTPGSGLRAENFLRKMERIAQTKQGKHSRCLQPNMESVYYAVAAYIDEEPLLYQNVVDADALVRRVFATNASFNDDTKAEEPLPVFEKILKAYAMTSKQRQDNRAVQAAESFYQFFLLQHRGGRTKEMPSNKHLGYILAILNSKPNRHTAERSVEFFRLFEQLKDNGLVRSEEASMDNIKLLLDTLAKSGQPGYGGIAAELLQQVVLLEKKRGTRKDNLEAILHCVAQCQELDRDPSRQHQSFDNLKQKQL